MVRRELQENYATSAAAAVVVVVVVDSKLTWATEVVNGHRILMTLHVTGSKMTE